MREALECRVPPGRGKVPSNCGRAATDINENIGETIFGNSKATYEDSH